MSQYRLHIGHEFIGTLVEDTLDFPWVLGSFHPEHGFERVRPLFDKERQLLREKRLEEWREEWDNLIRTGLILYPMDRNDAPIEDFLIHIEGSRFMLKSP